MIYPDHFEAKLGFDTIRQLLKERCLSDLGTAYVDKIRFSDNYDLIQKLTSQTAEFQDILTQGEYFPQQNYYNAHPYLKQAAIEGAFLDEAVFGELRASLMTIDQCLRFFAQASMQETYPLLTALSQTVEFDRGLVKQIDATIDERGKVRDNASPDLQRIRKSLIQEQNNLRTQLNKLLGIAKQQGYIKSDANITFREGRMVVPVPAEHKRKIKGFIHDESATGQTVYIEPAEVLDTNNHLKELAYQERREIIRILTALTAAIRPQVPQLQKAYDYLGMIDFIRAKAKLSLELGAVKPNFVEQPLLDWYAARHPLLVLSFAAQKKHVIPLDISLSEERRLLLISGPNAGGKSVSLKTVGLLQYMFQCGLLVPLAENSTIGLFKRIFIDIGDEQSLENDLSTYSAHLTHMRHFLRFSNAHTLLLIDEFGTGTEPVVGAAIAEAILEQLNAKRAFGVITTHYSNLKLLAENTKGLINGAMRFDAEKLSPLYILEIGKPGSSFAFEIAHKIGLPPEVIQRSRKKAGKQQVNFDEVLRNLEIERKQLHDLNRTLLEKEHALTETFNNYQKLKEYLEREKKGILNQAKQEASILLKEANQRIESTIREIKETQADKSKTLEVRQQLQKFAQKNRPEAASVAWEATTPEVAEAEVPIEVIEGNIEIDDYVRIKGQNAIGQVVALKGKNAEIAIGALKSTVKLDRLERLSRKAFRKEQQQASVRLKGINLNEKMMHFSIKLDLRGKRGEEAVTELTRFMDDAILLGQTELHILHGKGDGILRNLVRQQLRQYKQVVGIADEHADRGGDGITIVTLR
ncbi:endonuclease MutS2 [Eisenibacter elegans]|jgi:DNA mismatch repair protein MutS2|uniref:endonuclease MutS2 n=1 Tax=Eisenibacter elegans TaxID=997 RepID=UPI0003F8B7E7|nr:Smr/MutS family protein [Eisenibacter elegans]